MIRLLAGLALLWVALLLPVWVGSLSPFILPGIGHDSPSLNDLARLAAEENRAGRLAFFSSALGQQPDVAPSTDPVAGPYQFARAVLGDSGDGTVATALLQRSTRERALRQLEATPRRDVRRLLELRDETGWQRLPPSKQAGGVLTDVPLITLATLMTEGVVRPEFAVVWLGWQEDDSGLGRARMEEFFLGLLALSRELNFDQLAALTASSRSPRALGQMATLLRLYPGQRDLSFSLAVLSEDSGLLVETVGGSAEALQELSFFLPLGREALRARLVTGQALHIPPGWMQPLLRPLELQALPTGLSQLVYRFSGPFLALKMILFFAGMTLVFAGLGRLRSQRPRANPRLAAEARWVASALGALALLLPAWVMLEPQLVRGPTPALPSSALPVNLSAIIPSTDTMNIQDLFVDPVSLLMLGLFFLLQLIVYFFCLIKLAEIRRQPQSPGVKIALLENEENLFDSGLYLGLGGTVLSLILLTVGVLEASLMAAYASTLFGIIFVSALKIFHVRPFRRRLILSE